jgi:HAD superfamily hydrolase (TIGR01509 family)
VNRLIVFDLDGVLFESRDMHFETLNSALTYYGFAPIQYDEHIGRFNGLPTRVKLDMLGIKGEDAALVAHEKQAHTLGWVYKNVKRDNAMVTLFKDLNAAGWKIAVASNAITVTVIRALQLLGLWELCYFVTAGDRVAKPKPDPEIYLECMRRCDATPETTWIIEDSPVGREAARLSGANVVAVVGPSEVNEAVRTIMEVSP